MTNWRRLFCLPFNSIVVDDVDGDEINFSCNDTPYPQQAGMIQAEGDDVFDDNVDARSDISHSSRGSRGSTSREENETRLQQIKVNRPNC